MNIDDQLDDLLARHDDLLCEGRFDVIDQELKNLDITNVNSSILRMYLVTSGWAKEKFQYRQELYNRIYLQFFEKFGEEKTKRLLESLK